MEKGGTKVVTHATTGGQKEQNDIRLDLLPAEALWEVGRVYGLGAQKYAANNWRHGYDWSLSLAALHRHLLRFEAGESMDEGGFHHLGAVVFHALALMTFEREFPQGDDRYKT